MDKDKMAEDDKRRRERRKEREARREKDGRSKDGKSSKPRRKPQGLDLIDQLDVTGVYGHGGRKLDCCFSTFQNNVSNNTGQSSITTVHLMLATLTVTVRRITVLQCKPSLPALQTTQSVDLVL